MPTQYSKAKKAATSGTNPPEGTPIKVAAHMARVASTSMPAIRSSAGSLREAAANVVEPSMQHTCAAKEEAAQQQRGKRAYGARVPWR